MAINFKITSFDSVDEFQHDCKKKFNFMKTKNKILSVIRLYGLIIFELNKIELLNQFLVKFNLVGNFQQKIFDKTGSQKYPQKSLVRFGRKFLAKIIRGH